MWFEDNSDDNCDESEDEDEGEGAKEEIEQGPGPGPSDVSGEQTKKAPLPPPLPPRKNAHLLLDKAVLSDEQTQKLEALRSRPKRRPDWANMMKEIEVGRKLSHVVSNDRSAPLLPRVKAKGQFVYESERPNLHNQLLKQIESGIRLKPTKTNDRSRPFIDGLRKFRRQMTIEEQIQKSASMASMASMGIVEAEPDPLDEVDDIDKVRDDLQSTKQLLAMELKNKEALERENKKLLTRILNLEVEIEKEKNRLNKDTPEDRLEAKKEADQLRKDMEKARQQAEEMETKFHDTNAQLELVKLDLDDAVSKSQRLEKQLKVAQAANLAHAGQSLAKQPSSKKIIHQNKSMDNLGKRGVGDEQETEDESEDESEEESEEETDEEDNEEDAAVANEKRQAREIKLLQTKLKSFKDKRQTAKKERKALKDQRVKLQKSLKDEKVKYKVLQKEVDKMSKLMNEGEEDEEEEEEESDEEESQTESESEESEESESDESDGDLPESEPIENRKTNLQTRVKRYENLLSALKKGNYLLKANAERFKDELNKQKEMALTLQEDLNSVLAELG